MYFPQVVLCQLELLSRGLLLEGVEFLLTQEAEAAASPQRVDTWLGGLGTEKWGYQLQSSHRGMSVERGESEVGSKGRAVHRKDSSATGASSVHSGSAASVPLVEPLAHMVRMVIIGGLC